MLEPVAISLRFHPRGERHNGEWHPPAPTGASTTFHPFHRDTEKAADAAPPIASRMRHLAPVVQNARQCPGIDQIVCAVQPRCVDTQWPQAAASCPRRQGWNDCALPQRPWLVDDEQVLRTTRR